MKNYAGVEGCDKALADELEAAGIEVEHLGFPITNSEVPTDVYGILGAWGFTRAWTYWVASGPGIPPLIAEELHRTHGTEVRVDGDCGCPSPMERFKGFAVGCYHIDTAEGLKALACTIKTIIQDNK